MTVRCVLAVLALLLGVATEEPMFAQATDRQYEGDWFVSDTTNNATGEREVYAFQSHFPKSGSGYLSLYMRCSSGKPTFFVEWSELAFPDQTVVSIGPVTSVGSKPVEQGYVFEKSENPVENGLRATPDVSARIVSAIGTAKFTSITVRPSSGSRTAMVEVDGTLNAWNRVSRHCPVRIMPVPPM